MPKALKLLICGCAAGLAGCVVNGWISAFAVISIIIALVALARRFKIEIPVTELSGVVSALVFLSATLMTALCGCVATALVCAGETSNGMHECAWPIVWCVIVAVASFSTVCIGLVRFVVCRLDMKRAAEATQPSAVPVSGNLASSVRFAAFAVMTFVAGFVFEMIIGNPSGHDPIFRQYVPWYGFYTAILSGILFTSSALALAEVKFPRSMGMSVLLSTLILLLSFGIHLADAFSFFGYGMSFVACVRGFAERCAVMCIETVLMIAVLAIGLTYAFCFKKCRRAITRCGLTCARYLGNTLYIVIWFGLLGLLVYETLILMWINMVVTRA